MAMMQTRAADSLRYMTAVALERGNRGAQLLRVAAFMLLLLSLPAALLALGTATGLVPLPYELSLLDQRLPLLFRWHMASAGLALVLIPCAIAFHGLSVHRVVGRSAAILVLAGGATALPVALAGDATWPARAGFFAQGLVWIGLTLAAVVAIRRGRYQRHMWLMLCVAAVASGALWLRLAMWIAVRWGLPFDTVYALAAWACWVLPLGTIALRAVDRTRYPLK
jgi:Predicted membrane protein (DUF2306)